MTHAPSPRSWSFVGVLLLSIWFLASAPMACAQVAAAGAIVGTITDPTGAVIPRAQVTATNNATQQKRTVETNGQGFYAIESLLAAQYDLNVSAPGFQTFVAQNVAIDAGARVQVNASLVVGTEATQIQVQGGSIAVETASSESGGTLTGQQI